MSRSWMLCNVQLVLVLVNIGIKSIRQVRLAYYDYKILYTADKSELI